MKISGLKIIRFENCVISIFGTFLGAFISGYSIKQNFLSIFFTSLSPFFITAFGNIHNDIVDYKLDSIEKSNRPLVAKLLTINQAYILMIISSILGILVVINKPIHLAISVLVIIMLFIYNRYLKQTPLVGNVVVSFMVALTVFYGNLLTFYNNNLKIDWILLIFAFIINLLREITKDCEDYGGDKEMGLSTLPIIVGLKKMKFINIFLTATIAILIMIPNYLHYYGKIYLYFSFLIEIGLIYIIIKFFKSISRTNYHNISKLIKHIMLFGIILIYFDKLLIY